MREKHEVETILLREQDTTRRLLTFSALLSSESGLRGDTVIVVAQIPPWFEPAGR